jgi:FkbM family methyltransferase
MLMNWIEPHILGQLPLEFRLWARWIRFSQSNGMAVGGSALFQLACCVSRFIRTDGLAEFRHPLAPYKLWVDLADYETFNHSLGLWIGSSGEAWLISRMVGPQSVFLDIGANIGIYALQASALGARVLAFEPQQNPAEALRRSANTNKFDRLEVIENIAGSKAETVPFYVSQNGSGTGSRSSHWRAGSRRIDREAISIDAVIQARGIDKVDLIKIDVEGSEAEVLRGAPRTLRDMQPIVCFEWSGPSVGGMPFELLKSADYGDFYDLSSMGQESWRRVAPTDMNWANVVAVPDGQLEKLRTVLRAE